MHAAVTLLPYAMQHMQDDNACHQNITTLLQG